MKNANLIAESCLGVLLLSSVAFAAGTTVIVDDLDSGFSRYGPVSNWSEAAIGYGGHIYWTWNAQTTIENYARWRPNLPDAGTYAVSVYVPNGHAYTTTATYTIFHNGVADARVVNQNIFSNVWVGLGDFFFSAGGGEYVELADKTGEAYATTQIGFDAVSFTPVSSTRLLGVDLKQSAGVSIDWTQVHGAGISFAFSKSTEGTNIAIANFASGMQAGKNAGIVMGAYHFARPTMYTAVAEAQYFVNVAGSFLVGGYLRPVLDLEDGDSLGWPALSQWAADWAAEVRRLSGVDPIIYATRDYASNLDASLIGYPLWVAAWPATDPTGTGTPSRTGVWPTWTFWQYQPDVDFSGVSGAQVDLDVFHGDSAALNSYIIAGGETDENPPTISDFLVEPSSVTLGGSFTISYTVSDTGGSGLKQVELWRSDGDGSESDPKWQQVQTNGHFGNGPVSGSFQDTPLSVATYWYGLHVLDNASPLSNITTERQAGLGPLQRVVNPPTSLVSPPHGSHQTCSVTFQWNSVSGATKYRIYILAPGWTDFIYDEPTSTSYDYLPTIIGEYHWKVKAYVNGTWSDYSDEWTFYFDGVSAPTLTSPPNNSEITDVRPTFEWNSAPCANYYELQLARDSSFTDMVRDNLTIYGTSWRLDQDLTPGQTYYWRVRSSSPIGLWSAIWHFATTQQVTLSYITISGSSQVNENSGVQYACTAHYSDDSTSNVTSSASWSEDSVYATISSSGYLAASSVSTDQPCQITATYEGESDTHDVTIKNIPDPLVGDFCGPNGSPPDGYVDVWDLMQFADYWHSRNDDGNWDSKFDLTGPDFGAPDGYVDVWDLMVFADNWHKGQKP